MIESLSFKQAPTPVHSFARSGYPNLFVKLDYLAHPYIQGNKWRKLKYVLEFLTKEKRFAIASMGGAFSNHVHALAQLKKFQAHWQIEIYVRGERPRELSPTLAFAIQQGIQIHFTDREKYRAFRQRKAGFYENIYWLPEGGTTTFANKGCQELYDEIESSQFNPDIILLAGGTGGTAAGLINASPKAPVWVHSSLMGFDFREQIQQHLQIKNPNFDVVQDTSCGGFGKTPAHLIDFINNFYQTHQLPLDPIYNGKLFYWLFEALKKGMFMEKKVLVIHTGGLDGIDNYNFRYPQRRLNIPTST